MAAACPDLHILGIERQSERVRETEARIARKGLANAKVVRADAAETLRLIPPASVSQIHILFSDPWPKRRHADRRLMTGGFLAECCRCLDLSGCLRFLTDDEPHAQAFATLTHNVPDLIPDAEPEFPLTTFEARFAREGKPVHRFFYRWLGHGIPAAPASRSPGHQRFSEAP
jgi:tRNA (guanine-N7-)-methyltransferase